uniref:membrane-spanning 4-domains subfamily A member 15-like n=1 Tax=Euleptes europaea TaxID=460621 RepID=UPI002540091B|nr:membrane-spanning 4-domains subfamily A member 15-like [Euleptes europaea]
MDLRDSTTLESISMNVIPPPVPQPVKTLYRGEPMALGITQILIGIFEFTFGLVRAMAAYGIHYYSPDHHITTPYWMGILYIISGSLSVAVARNPKVSLVKFMLGMNVVSSVGAGTGIILLSISIAHSRYYYMCDPYYTRSVPTEICREFITIPVNQMQSISAVLLAFTILEFFITITTAAFGCTSLCRNSFSETTVVIYQYAPQEDLPASLPAKGKEQKLR